VLIKLNLIFRPFGIIIPQYIYMCQMTQKSLKNKKRRGVGLVYLCLTRSLTFWRHFICCMLRNVSFHLAFRATECDIKSVSLRAWLSVWYISFSETKRRAPQPPSPLPLPVHFSSKIYRLFASFLENFHHVLLLRFIYITLKNICQYSKKSWVSSFLICSILSWGGL